MTFDLLDHRLRQAFRRLHQAPPADRARWSRALWRLMRTHDDLVRSAR